MKKTIRLAACVLLLCVCTVLYAQADGSAGAETRTIDFTEKDAPSFTESDEGDVGKKVERDFKKAEFTEADFRHGAIAAGEVFSFNIFITTFNRIITRSPFADISLETMGHNITHPWVWDQDEFEINQIGHPYQGSIYFAAGRANGFNFWQSFAFAAFGSLMWEYTMENEPPSFNDFIHTPIGGSFLGEMFHRIYLSLDDKYPYLSWIASPQAAFNRLLTGEKAPREEGGIEAFSLRLSADHIDSAFGFSDNAYQDKGYRNVVSGGIGFDILYGNPYVRDIKKPFERFTLSTDASFDGNYYDIKIFADGFLRSWVFEANDAVATTLALDLSYDFIMATDLNYQNNSFGFSVRQRYALPHKWTIEWKSGMGATYLGASDYYFNLKANKRKSKYDGSEQRLYDLGIGGNAKAGFKAANPWAGTFFLEGAFSAFYTIPGSAPPEGSSGYNLIWYGNAAYEHCVYKNYYAGLSFFLYQKFGFYTKGSDVFQTTSDWKLYVKRYF